LHHFGPELNDQLGHLFAFEPVAVELLHVSKHQTGELQLVFHGGDVLSGLEVEGQEIGGRLVERVLF
jgi:hypothetical protein